MLHLKSLLAVLYLFSLPTLSAEQWWKINGDPMIGNFSGGHYDQDLPAKLKQVLSTTHFKEWETYEDDMVKFKYPKHPFIQLEVKKNNAAIEVEGGVCTTVDNSFQNAYYITVKNPNALATENPNPITYGVFLLTAADWLDDGICMCGPMVHHVYNVEQGCLVRFSLLPGGAVKKAQVQGDKLRLMSFEWTHLACPKEVYETMVESMELKIKSKLTEKELQEKVEQLYGHNGLTGFVHRDMTVEQASSILGKVHASDNNSAEWRGITGDYNTSFTVNLKDGEAYDIVNSSTVRFEGQAIEGTLSWATEQISDKNGNIKGGNKITPQLLKRIETIALAELDDSDQPWVALRILQGLAEHYQFSSKASAQKILSLDHDQGLLFINLLDIMSEQKTLSKKELQSWKVSGLKYLSQIDAYSSRESSMFTQAFKINHDYFTTLLEDVIVSDPEIALVLLKQFIEIDSSSWSTPLIENFQQHLSPEQLSSLFKNAFIHNYEKTNYHPAYQALKSINELSDFKKLTKHAPSELLTLIKTLPKGDKDSEWLKQRNDTIKKLEATLKE